MRTPQRVEQFHREVEIKKAKARRDELRRKQAAAGVSKSVENVKPLEVQTADPVEAPAVIEAAPEEVLADPVVADAEAETPVEPAIETTESKVSDVSAEAPEPVVATTTRKRRS